MKKIHFKAERKSSNICHLYRKISKYGDLHIDISGDSDDVINITPSTLGHPIKYICIDCNKKTGVFTLKID